MSAGYRKSSEQDLMEARDQQLSRIEAEWQALCALRATQREIADDLILQNQWLDGYRRLDTDQLPLRVVASIWFMETLVDNSDLARTVRQLQRAHEDLETRTDADITHLTAELAEVNRRHDELLGKYSRLRDRYDGLRDEYNNEKERWETEMSELQQENCNLEREKRELEVRLRRYEGPSSYPHKHRGRPGPSLPFTPPMSRDPSSSSRAPGASRSGSSRRHRRRHRSSSSRRSSQHTDDEF